MSTDNQEILKRLEKIQDELQAHRKEETNNAEAIKTLRDDMLEQFRQLSLGPLLDSVKRGVEEKFGGQLAAINDQLAGVKEAIDRLAGGKPQ